MRAGLKRLPSDLQESYLFVPTVMAMAVLLFALSMIVDDSDFWATWMDGSPCR